ncbi:TonB-dependent receptor [uncultured Desulfuromonas sp.]|uniref:TonB-dependent receptor n=1 Tax=uncultured Desulfuromonas sp. TaxID=181013 RepID=UPI002AAA7CD7|nr:TonB-dependent receptor [uncultured Desulfuromonas sp.]
MHHTVSALLLLLLLSAPAVALVDGDEETIVVTAQKFSQPQNITPISMDVFSRGSLEEKEIHTLKDLSRFAANVHVKADNVGNAVMIRGVSPFVATLQGPAGIFIDGVALPTVFMQQPSLLHLGRVEILKGPQGTLYGSNTESGVIHLVTASVDNETRAACSARVGLYDSDDHSGTARLQAEVGGPLQPDRLFLSVAAALEKTDGYFTNLATDDDQAGEYERKDVHLKLRAPITEKLEIFLSSLYLDAVDAKGKFRYTQGPAATKRYTINYNDRYDQDYSGSVTSLHIDYHPSEDLAVHSITGLTTYQRNFDKDFDGTVADRGRSAFDLDDLNFSEELRLQHPEGQWLLGLFVNRQDSEVMFEKTAMQQRRSSDIDTRTCALFGTYNLPVTASGSLALGLRVERTKLDADMDYRTASGNAAFQDSETFDQWLPRLAWNQRIADGVLYASVAKGYLCGGVNYNLATSRDSLLYGDEESISYEVGYKQDFAAARCRLSAALFYIDMSDKQVSRSSATQMGVMEIANVAAAASYGAELGLTLNPLTGLDLYFNGGYTRAKADDTRSNDLYAGKDLPYVPRFTASVGGSYLHGNGMFIGGDVMATSSFYHDGENRLQEGGYATVDVRGGYLTEHYTVTLWCKNLFDRHYRESATYWGTYEVVEDAAPRSFGLQLDYRF